MDFLKNFKVFEFIDVEAFLDHGIPEEFGTRYLIDPYGEHKRDQIDPYHVSYSYVTRRIIGENEYRIYEEKLISFFEELFHFYKITGFQLRSDRVSVYHYYTFLSFRHDLELALREDTSISFLIDEIPALINCNFDLVLLLCIYDGGLPDRIKDICIEKGINIHIADAGN